MSYSLQIKRSAAKELTRIKKSDRSRLLQAIDALTESPFRGSVLKGELQGLRRIRVGEYRVVYEVQDDVLVVLVLRIAHRREVYRSG